MGPIPTHLRVRWLSFSRAGKRSSPVPARLAVRYWSDSVGVIRHASSQAPQVSYCREEGDGCFYNKT